MLVPVRTGPGVAARTHLRRHRAAVEPETVILVAVIVVGAAIRLATLGSQSYWTDEATTVHDIRMSFGGMLHQVHVSETTPPLYFIVAWLWAKVFGTGEVGLRLLSALLGIVLVPIAYLCGRELVSRAAGLVAAALAAVSPYMVWYSQEARSYMLFAVFSGLSFLYCSRAWNRRERRDVVWWGVWSGLAVLTHFFAAFLVAPEAILLLYRLRSRVTVVVAAAVAVVQLTIVPLAVSDTSHPLGWIQAFPLSIRIKQVPVDFGLSALYQSALVTDGLLFAAIVVVIVIALLMFGGGPAERRGAVFSAGLAAFVVFVPILLAEIGRDYLVPRNLTPAWIPLAVVLAAACTVPRARVAGAAFAAALIVVFLWAGIRIDNNPQYQRPNWRGVAEALGTPTGTRAIVAYDQGFAAQPLAIYMRGVPWLYSPSNPVTVSEVDVVGSTWQAPPSKLPPGTKLISSTAVDGFQVDRFSVQPGWTLTPNEFGSRAGSLLAPALPQPSVLVQRTTS